MPLDVLPLFPLGTVLVPGLVLPLHVFEPRYRQLVRDLLATASGPARGDVSGWSDGAPAGWPEAAAEASAAGALGRPARFGVVAIRRGTEVGAESMHALYEVGCAAELRRVDAHGDGTFDVVAVGTTRFRVASGIRTDRPYFTADVEWLAEPVGDGGAAARLARRVHDELPGYLEQLAAARGVDLDSAPELPAEPVLLSYLLTMALLVDVHERQQLLAAPDAVTRLRLGLALLRRERAMLAQVGAAPLDGLPHVPLSPN